MSIAVVIFFSVPFLFRKNPSIAIFGNLISGLVTALTAFILSASAGIYSPVCAWLAMPSVIAFLLIGKRWGYFWAMVCAIIVAFFWLAATFGYSFPILYSPNWILPYHGLSSIGSIIVFLVLAAIFKSAQEKAQGNLESEKASVQRRVEEAVAALLLEQEAARKKDEEILRTSEELQTYLETSISTILVEMEKFSEGDLTVSVSSTANDNIGRLYGGFNHAIGKMRGLVGRVTAMVEETAATSAGIARRVQGVGEQLQVQSSRTTEMATAVEEMTATIGENARQTMSVAEEAVSAERDAAEGGRVVEATMQAVESIAQVISGASATMRALGESSENIGEITKIIDEIADQTNLLALNAAIEAARAGDQGRGFAVVADEVRKLAERTQTATKEIEQTVKTIQQQATGAIREIGAGEEKVVTGKAMASQARESLRKIMERTRRVSEIIRQIATAEEEQSRVAVDIAQSIEEIRQITENSVAAMSEVLQDVEQMSVYTEELDTIVRSFRVKQSQQPFFSHRQSMMLED